MLSLFGPLVNISFPFTNVTKQALLLSIEKVVTFSINISVMICLKVIDFSTADEILFSTIFVTCVCARYIAEIGKIETSSRMCYIYIR